MKFKTNKIKDIRQHYLEELNKLFSASESGSFMDMIFEEYLSMTRVQRQLNQDYRLSEPEMLKVHFAVKQLKKNRPIQYILQRATFYGHEFFVDENVLIPRPETEELVEWIINDYRKHESELKILDIGTGSGCIAVSLKKSLPESRVWAMDISADALDVAKRNASANAVEINLIQQDVLRVEHILKASPFDIIVSNPPYVRESEKREMSENVLGHEPAQALFVNDADPLIYYRKISEIAHNSISPQGRLYLEINQNFGKETMNLLIRSGFKDVVLRQDLNGNDRMIRAVWGG